MPRQVRNPWLELATQGIFASASRALTRRSLADDAVARSCGFENAEHEVLAFLASDWCNELLDGVLGLCGNVPGQRVPEEYIQMMLDRAYGSGEVEIVPAEPEEIPHREDRRPRDKGYVAIPRKPGTSLLEAYSAIIRAEQERPIQLVLELPGVTLETLEDEVCAA